jgi:hypothetical protein
MGLLGDDEETSVNIIIHKIAEYISQRDLPCDVSLELFIFLLYSPFIITTRGVGAGYTYSWKFYDAGIWSTIDKEQVANMISVRVIHCRLYELLNIRKEQLDKSLSRMLRSGSFNTLQARFYNNNFADKCDDKNKVFVTYDSTYDIQHCIMRRGLPSDVATLRSNRRVDINGWNDNKDMMYQELATWLPDVEVREFYLDVLASSIREYPQRYCLINSGTGSDGKSTFTHIIQSVFGAYCYSCPSKGPMLDAKNANDATPLANSLMGRRVCVTADVKDVSALLSSPSFKSISGGDTMYTRMMHKEATQNQQQLVMLCIVNTNQVKCSVSNIAEMTRIRVVNFSRKMMNSNDMGIVPQHQLQNCKDGKSFYHKTFISKYGDCLLTELILRDAGMSESGSNVGRCMIVMEWTKLFVAPTTIFNFITACTERIDANDRSVVDELEEEELLALQQIVSTGKEMARIRKMAENKKCGKVNLLELFLVYTNWRKGFHRIEQTDATTYAKFKEQIGYYFNIIVDNDDGVDTHYITGIRIKDMDEIMGYRFGRKQYNRRVIDFGFGVKVRNDDDAPIVVEENPGDDNNHMF